MKTSDFDYELPQELIAQTPVEPRDSSRLLVYHRDTGAVEHKIFRDVIDYLNPGDVLVINQTRVIPARLYGVKEGTGGAIEFLLLRRLNLTDWEVILKPGKKAKPGARFVFGNGELVAEILTISEDGGRTVRFFYEGVFEDVLDRLGQMPLPPYIHEKLEDKTRYQTVYAKVDGSAAAPTAGLHFTPELLEKIKRKGIDVVPVLLHVGLGTFRPVKEEDVADHHMHSEYYEVTPEQADCDQRRPSARRPHRLRRHNERAHAGNRLDGGRHRAPRQRLHPDFHHPRREDQGGGRAHHQLPPAAEHAAHAHLRADGPRKRAGRL